MCFPHWADRIRVALGRFNLGKRAAAAAESGPRVYYGTLAGLIESLTEAKAAATCPADCAC